MEIKSAVILAGGLGTRLREKVADKPKCMVPVFGVPFLDYQLAFLETAGIRNVILAVGHMHDQVIAWYGEKWRNISIAYSIENEPLGTGGAVKKAALLCPEDAFLVLNGDTFFTIELDALLSCMQQTGADAVVALRQMPDTGRYGSVITGPDARIMRFEEKKAGYGPGFINGGIYLIRKSILLLQGLPDKFSLEKEFFSTHCQQLWFYGQPFDTYFIDMGIPEDLKKAEADFYTFAKSYGFTQ